MTDLDKSGFGFQRVRTYLGPSLGWVDELVQPTVDITTGGVHVVQPGESLLLVEVAAAVTIQLPDVVRWMQQTAYQPATGFDRSITVKDIGGNAANFNIIVAPFGQQSIDNIQQSTIISTARANVKFVPLLDLTGWAVQSNTGAGGGGGGGDVFKAGNNTFTGLNAFNNTITVPNQLVGDNSNNAASTSFVKAQGYITSVSLAPYALIASPVFTGDPQAPTPSPGDNDASIATTAFVQAALVAVGTPAPASAEYITSSANATLTAERVLTNTASITWDFSTPGQAKASTSAGGGNVSSSGSPVNGQLAQWVTPTTITGVDGSTLYAPIASPLFTGDPRAPTPAITDNDISIATTAYVKANLANFQPLDADLTAISGLGGTNTIYYRSAPDIWSPVTFSGLSFSGGVLSVSAGGGNVNNSGTPTAGQYSRWTNATTIQGVPPATVLSDIGAQPAGNYQPLDADLTAIAGLASAADQLPYFTGVGAAALTTMTAAARTVLDDTTVGAMLTTLGGLSTADAAAAYQPLDGDLTSLAGASATNAIYYRSAANTWATVTIGANMTFASGVLDSLTGSGGGNVSNSGTPTVGQYGKWVTATTIQGVPAATVLTDIGAQPLDGDLSSLAAASATNALYYRSAANTWGPVTIGTGLTFTGGTLAAGGGNVNNSGVPTVGQIAQWTDATHIQGVAASSLGFAPIASPVFTGDPQAPTPATADNDTSIATTAFVKAAIASATTGAGSGPPQGRLTLLIGAPIMPGTQPAKTTIYYTPYVGNQVPIYNGTNVVMTAFAELNVLTTDTTKSPAAIGVNKCNDWFVWNDAGTLRLSHGPDWTDDASRSAGTALVRLFGIPLNNVSITNGPAAQRGTYVGTTRSNASSQLDWIIGAPGVAAFLGLWNAYNRVDVSAQIQESADSWSVPPSTVRQMNNSPANQVSFVVGLQEDAIDVSAYLASSQAWTANAPHGIGIGYDVTNAISSVGTSVYSASGQASSARFVTQPGMGFHYVAALDVNGDSAAITYYGDTGNPVYVASGLTFRYRM